MQFSHYLIQLHPVRAEMPYDMNEHEQKVMGEHFVYLKKLTQKGVVLMAGPVFGDPVYGGTARALQRVRREQRPVLFALAKRLSRQALHAYHLAFRHPVGGGWCRFEAPVPNDLDEVLSALTEQEAVR